LRTDFILYVVFPLVVATSILSGNIFLVVSGQAAPGQNTTGTFDQLFKDRFKADYILSFSVVYESPKMVVLKGNLLTFASEYNTAFWKAIEVLENEYGFNIDKFAVNGIGSEINPERFYVIMTKAA
jgi:hypothetical protein